MTTPNASNERERKALVMILGAARSGTTMLDLMLGNADDVFSCGEVWCLYRPHRTHHFRPKCLCGDPECDVWANLSPYPASRFHAAALDQPGINFVIDSSKDLRWVLDSNDWARRSGIRVINVVTWKDPIDLAYSHWKRGRPVDHYRGGFLRYYGRILDLGLPFVSIGYSRAIADPALALRALCEYIGMDYQPGREEFWQKRHHHLFGSAGTARQVSSGKSQLVVQREFPEDFVQQFERSQERNPDDPKLAEIVRHLEAHELGGKICSDDAGFEKPLLKPAWYYYHGVKSIYRKWFPYAGPIAD